MQVIARAGGVCERCRERRGEHVHHLRYGGKLGTEPLEWLQLVCLPCHGDYHPHHTFRPIEEQRRIANERRRGARKKKVGRAKCAHCGGMFPAKRHAAICVKYGLDKAQPHSTQGTTDD